MKTLNDFQKLLGDINWLRPMLGIPTHQLRHLFSTLEGDTALNSPLSLTSQAKEELHFVEQRLNEGFLTYLQQDQPIYFIVFHTPYSPTGVIAQSTGLIEWVFLPNNYTKKLTTYTDRIAFLILKGRGRITQLIGSDPQTIITQLTSTQISNCLQFNENWQIALASYSGTFSNQYPQSKMIDFLRHTSMVCKSPISNIPVEGKTIFTDANKNTAGYWTDTTSKVVPHSFSSVQPAELWAICLALQDFCDIPINIVSDSKYAVFSCIYLPEATLPVTLKTNIDKLFFQVQQLLIRRTNPVFFTHIRAHSSLPGPLSQGNANIDALLYPLQSATQEHCLHHTNSKGLQKTYSLTRKQAQRIVRSCSICAPFILPFAPPGVNPRGLQSNQIWQMDIVFISSFGKQKYVHHTIDTYSHFQWTTALSSEKADSAITHLLFCFAIMGIPIELKTDNAPVYQSSKLSQFLEQYHIKHIFGIPYNSQGQAIIERANRTLREYIEKIKKRKKGVISPRDVLNKTLLTLNFLNVWGKSKMTPAEQHFGNSEKKTKKL